MGNTQGISKKIQEHPILTFCTQSMTRLVKWALPWQCPSCRLLLDERGLCGTCWAAITFVSDPVCQTCGLPLSIPTQRLLTCASCLKDPPPFDRARAVFVYDHASKPLLFRFKHGRDLTLAPLLGRWMSLWGRPFLEPQSTILIPVPLHWTRLWKRRFNQAAVLAHKVAQYTDIPMIPDALIRTRRTPPQGHLSPEQRKKNVAKAFRLCPKHRGNLKGKKIILIDDVYTTGATLKACCATLRQADVKEINILTLARAAQPSRSS